MATFDELMSKHSGVNEAEMDADLASLLAARRAGLTRDEATLMAQRPEAGAHTSTDEHHSDHLVTDEVVTPGELEPSPQRDAPGGTSEATSNAEASQEEVEEAADEEVAQAKALLAGEAAEQDRTRQEMLAEVDEEEAHRAQLEAEALSGGSPRAGSESDSPSDGVPTTAAAVRRRDRSRVPPAAAVVGGGGGGGSAAASNAGVSTPVTTPASPSPDLNPVSLPKKDRAVSASGDQPEPFAFEGKTVVAKAIPVPIEEHLRALLVARQYEVSPRMSFSAILTAYVMAMSGLDLEVNAETKVMASVFAGIDERTASLEDGLREVARVLQEQSKLVTSVGVAARAGRDSAALTELGVSFLIADRIVAIPNAKMNATTPSTLPVTDKSVLATRERLREQGLDNLRVEKEAKWREGRR